MLKLLKLIFIFILFLILLQTKNVSPVFADWPMVAGNSQRTSYTPDSVTGNLQVEWSWRLDPAAGYIPLNSQIIAANNRVYVSTAKGLYTFDAATGSLIWRFDTEIPLGNSPTYANEVLYVGGYDHKLYAINAVNGAKIWEFTGAQAGYNTNPVVADGKVMLGNRDGYFYAVNQSDGSLAWKYKTDGPINLSAAYKNQVVYFASMDNYGYALNTNGNFIWKTLQMQSEGFYSYWPVVYTNPDNNRDYVIFVAANGYRAFDRPGVDTLRATTPCNNYQWCEWYDEFSGNVSGSLATTGPSQTWAAGKTVYDYSTLLDYYSEPTATEIASDLYGLNRFHHKPWRRLYYVYDTQLGTEYTMTYNGRKTYTPIDPYLSNSGSPYPPIANGDGLLYFGNHYTSDGFSRLAGWRMGTPYMVFANIQVGAGDEPNAFSVGGSTLYRSIAVDRIGDYVNTSGSGGGTLWSYDRTLGSQVTGYETDIFCPGPRYGSDNYDGLYCNWGGANGIYWEHGDQNPLVPYIDNQGKGHLYSFHSNNIVAFGTSGATKKNWGVLPAVTNPLNKGTSISLPDLKTRLETEISKMVTAGHLRPGYYNAGQFNEFYPNLADYFNFPSETIYALAAAYPYIDNTTANNNLKDRLKTYLDSEYTNYFKNGSNGWMGWANGVGREWGPLMPEVQRDLVNYPKGGTSDKFGSYALWKYYQNVYSGDNTKRTEFVNLANGFGNSNIGTQGDTVYDSNRNAAGTFGLAKLNNQNPTVSSCNWFSENSPWTGGPPNQWRTLNLARNFMYLTPEVGDCFNRTNLTTITAAIGRFNNVGSYWFVSRFTASLGESTMQNLYDYPAMFAARAYILKEPREQLTKWLDVPAFKVGDLFYIQNVVAAIEAPSNGSPVPSPSAVATSTPVPSPSPITRNGDANSDGVVNIADIILVINNYAKNLTTSVDQYIDGKINAFDFAVVIKNLLKPSPTPGGPSPSPIAGGPPGNASDWTMTFADEFDGTSLDTNKWLTKYSYDSGNGDRSNNDEKEWYVDNAFTLNNSILTITAKKECLASNRTENYAPYTGNCTTNISSRFPVTSGIITSVNSFSQKYGYFEARIKIPAAQGMWPAFWLLPMPSPKPATMPWADPDVFWPPEMDIMENKGQEPNVIRMNNIYSADYPNPGGQANNWSAAYDLFDTTGDTTNYSSNFHTYGLDWEANAMVWYIDGVEKHRVTTNIPPGNLSPGEMYLIANLAAGGTFGGDLSSTTFPQSLQIDYIRAYQKNASASPVPSTSPVSSATPVPSVIPSSTPGGTIIVDFESYSGPEAISGEYPLGSGINWGSNQWLFSTPWELLTSNSTYFASTSSNQGVITFSSPKTLVSVLAYNGNDTTSSTVTLSCSGNTAITRSVGANATPVTIITNWTNPCAQITITASTGQDTNFDNFTLR